ncbi:uncharacterized protein K452DRAFT_227367 [Aplosporella prunicola CBS 121167]|uniref:SCP domain-containing protein n=1 Tax=Aplosporella prunicola CBS 121167 TaxID=1176127 RepID=A0A6A6BFY9_9PEZI|nr:uncharacterized protein K452DRAFT_227367 [Aplosporella prunicola CBS 121167]KAF2142164.1 hypothetical protein K452DRAFT_227367 [Aplosporella prunicola CBS 121167]
MTQDPQQQQQQRNAIVTTTVATTTLGAVATGAAGASADYTNATRFKKTLLDGSNAVRANHNASALHWNDTLAAFAEDWVKGCGFRHSNGPYGENLATNYANTSAALAAWANEAAAFDFQDPGFSKQTGHFSQLVWKGTTSVGCARKDCSASEGSADGWYVVCEYSPRGNVIGAFEGNVQAAMDGAEEGEGGNSAGSGGGQSGNGRCGKVSAENGCIEAHKNGAVARGAVWGLKWSTLLVVGSAGWAAVGW